MNNNKSEIILITQRHSKMFKTLALLPAIFAGVSALKTTQPQFYSVPDDDVDAFSVPVRSQEDMEYRLLYTQEIFD